MTRLSEYFKKIVAKIGIVALIMAVLTVSIVYSSINSSVTIPNNGTVLSKEVTAVSGSVQDIQAAVNVVAAAGGGNVHIPAGNFTFDLFTSTVALGSAGQLYGVKIPGGVNVIGAGNNQTILYMGPNCWRSGGAATSADTMFYLDGSNNKPIRISGILFQGSINYSSTLISTRGSSPYADDGGCSVGIEEHGVTNFRIDHCTFLDFVSGAIWTGADWFHQQGNEGVIDHCIIDNPYKNIYWNMTGYFPNWGYGIGVGAGSGNWNGQWRTYSELFGQYGPDIVYIEDNSFARCRHCIASSAGEPFYVARYNNFTDNIPEYTCSFMDCHPWSRGFEAYGNIYTDVALDYRSMDNPAYWGKYLNRAFTCHSGSGLIYNNTIINCLAGPELSEGGVESNETKRTNGWWIWDNTYINVQYPVQIFNGSGEPFTIVEGDEYFLRVPNQAQDGFGYTPFPYPFPFSQYGMGNV